MTQENEIVFRKSTRVVIRPVLKSDISLIMRWINDPEVTQYLATYEPMMEADEVEWIEKLHTRKPNNFAFTIVVDRNPIGVMGIHNVDWRSGTATTGALIGEKECWGKGYGSEAKMLVLDFAFNTLNLRKICSMVIEFNGRSYAYSMKCGYKEEARLRAQHVSHGKYWDEIHLAVFRDDWLPLWETFKKEHGIFQSAGLE